MESRFQECLFWGLLWYKKAIKCELLVFKEAAPYRVRTAFRTGQPPPFIQHLHQTHDRHLTMSPADHVQETLHRTTSTLLMTPG